MSRRLVLAVPAVVFVLAPAVASAQSAARAYEGQPSDGMDLPDAPRAGDADARNTVTAAAGLAFLEGGELTLALGVDDPERSTTNATSFGLFAATPFGGGWSPRLGLGLGLEWLRPDRAGTTPDPGTPFRLTVSHATRLGRHTGFGGAWHHVFDDGHADGLDGYDLSLTTRFGDHLAATAQVRDVYTPRAFGRELPRRYELELALRPTGTRRLEVAAGGRIDEVEGDLDGWGRLDLQLARGLDLHAIVESRHLAFTDTMPDATVVDDGRELRVTAGFSLSFGSVAVTSLGQMVRDERGDAGLLGGTLVLRASQVPGAPVQGYGSRLDVIALTGSLDTFDVIRLTERLAVDASDPHLRGVLVLFDSPQAGWASREELRTALVRLRAAGKKVFAHLVNADTRDYYVASAADRIYLDPVGGLELLGVATTTRYFRGTFDAVGITPEFDKIAEYKSAPESFTETGATPAAAKMRAELTDGVWAEVVDAIAAGRHLDRQAVLDLVDAGSFTPEQLAKDHRLVDAVADPEHVDGLIATELAGDLGRIGGPARTRAERWTKPMVAVVTIDGDIIDGESKPTSLLGGAGVGGATIVAAIDEALADDRVRAIVLRIDSPGGSAQASEIIARAVFAARGHKPIVCSFGDYAASGGYFAAAGCERIFAPRTTITGSIGIFGGKFDLSRLLDKLGVTTEVEQRGRFADLHSWSKPYTDDERRLVRERLRYMYGRFVGAVAEGRHLTREQVDAVGRGHVWTGAQAKDHGLVDVIGTGVDAIAYAAERGGIPKDRGFDLLRLPRPRFSLTRLLTGGLFGRAEVSDADAAAALLRQVVSGFVPAMLAPNGAPLARLPFTLEE